jgi:DNA-binding transcriptional ArsR family regulator
MKELRELNQRIVMLIAEAMPLGLTPYQIREKITTLTPDNLNIHLKILLKKGIVTKHKESILVYYRIAPEGVSIVSRLVAVQPKKLSMPSSSLEAQEEATLTARAHKFGVAYPLKDKLTMHTPSYLLTHAGISAKPVPLKNNNQAYFSTGKITARLTNSTLLIYTADLYTDNRTPSIEIESKIKQEFDALALSIEEKLNEITTFKLRRIDKDILASYITTQHWAEEHHALAEASKENHLILAKNKQDGNDRLGIDRSKGFRELETYHSKTADIDKDLLDREFNELLDGNISLFDIPAHTQAIADIEKVVQEYGKQLTIHIPYFQKQTEVLEKHERILSQLELKLQAQAPKPSFWRRVLKW